VTTGDRIALAALSLGAAAVHFAMVPVHAGESRLEALGFATAGWLGLAFAVAILLRPSYPVLAGGVVLHLGLVGVWGWSRTAGWEEVGTVDVVTVAMEAALVILASLALRGPVRLPLAPSLALAALLCGVTTVAVTAPSTAEHGHGSGGETHEVALAAETHAHAETVSAPVEETESGDGLAHEHHLPTSGAAPTSEQLLRAADLVTRTTAAISPRFDDTEAARAAGFIPLQGEQATFVHWVNMAWLGNENVLDPAEPESLVYRSTPDGQVLEAAMYILPRKGMPIPDVGGSLTAWHNHGDLCFRTSDARIVGTTANGPCPTGSVNVPTPDMLHVWIVEHPGGPFAGIE
jgi:hypothetical protein